MLSAACVNIESNGRLVIYTDLERVWKEEVVLDTIEVLPPHIWSD
jgi:hypothetical protein